MWHEFSNEANQGEIVALAFFKLYDKPAYVSKISEKKLDSVAFNVFKFNHRLKPKKADRIKVVSCFSEFGCEIIGSMYCLPRLLRRFPGNYVIAMGWYGREFLYRHLVDEYWELKEEYMWLRDHARAFHHISDNLRNLERAATKFGNVVPAAALGKYAVCNFCRTCGKFWHEWRRKYNECPACQSTLIVTSIFTDIGKYKPQAIRIPRPSKGMLEWAHSFIKPNSVGIFARGRKTYGRNLQPEFYVKLIELLESLGYEVIWLGEKQSTQPCPVPHVVDFSRMPESRDLERTLAIICNLQFTIQFWTASTRLAGMMGVPYILFESPEQIYVSMSGIMGAQEGKRLELSTFGPKKIVLSHFINAYENHGSTLNLVKQAVDELNAGNYEDMLGMVENPDFVIGKLQQEHLEMLT